MTGHASAVSDPDWNPRLYTRFAAARAQPFHDLLARLDEHVPATIADLGCGTGALTRLLCRRWPAARVWGVDASAAMLADARAAGDERALVFVEADLAAWRAPAPLDLLFSNAALQWLPDHAALLDVLAMQLAPGGVLAVQVPNNYDAPAFRLVLELLDEAPWAGRLRHAPVFPRVESPVWYADVLHRLGLEAEVWETTYHHALPDAAAIVAWLQGTVLRPALAALPPETVPDFLAALTKRMAARYPLRAWGVDFPFRRLFFVGRRVASR